MPPNHLPMKRVLLTGLFVGIAIFAGLIALFVWSPTLVLNTAARGGDVFVQPGVGYGDDPRQKLDVYRPRETAPNAPVVVFFYGGSWQWGNRTLYRFVGAALARRGMITIIPDYRVYPPAVYPDFLQDSARAVRWAKENAARLGGDPARLFLIGHSAGAYNAAMLNLDPRWLAAEGLDPRRDVIATIGIAGPYDFLPVTSEALKVIFGPEETRPLTQPIRYADGKAPPMLLLRPAKDSIVDPDNATRLAARIRANGGEATVVTYDWVGHLSIIGTFSPLMRFLAPALDDIHEFIEAAGRGAKP